MIKVKFAPDKILESEPAHAYVLENDQNMMRIVGRFVDKTRKHFIRFFGSEEFVALN